MHCKWQPLRLFIQHWHRRSFLRDVILTCWSGWQPRHLHRATVEGKPFGGGRLPMECRRCLSLLNRIEDVPDISRQIFWAPCITERFGQRETSSVATCCWRTRQQHCWRCLKLEFQAGQIENILSIFIYEHMEIERSRKIALKQRAHRQTVSIAVAGFFLDTRQRSWEALLHIVVSCGLQPWVLPNSSWCFDTRCLRIPMRDEMPLMIVVQLGEIDGFFHVFPCFSPICEANSKMFHLERWSRAIFTSTKVRWALCLRWRWSSGDRLHRLYDWICWNVETAWNSSEEDQEPISAWPKHLMIHFTWRLQNIETVLVRQESRETRDLGRWCGRFDCAEGGERRRWGRPGV